MPLHEVTPDKNDSYYDVYAQSPSEKPLSKFKISDMSNDPKTIRVLILDELLLDGNAKQNLATFCQTYVDDDIHFIMDKCIDKNLIDKDEYPQTAAIEERCVHIRHRFSRDMAQLMIDNLKRSIDYFQKHPTTNGLEESEGQSFHH